jgi:hypothetical protein
MHFSHFSEALKKHTISNIFGMVSSGAGLGECRMILLQCLHFVVRRLSQKTIFLVVFMGCSGVVLGEHRMFLFQFSYFSEAFKKNIFATFLA